MNKDKLFKLIGDLAVSVVCIYALDGIRNFLRDYNATKARVDVLEEAVGMQAMILLREEPTTAEEPPKRKRTLNVKATGEPFNAVSEPKG